MEASCQMTTEEFRKLPRLNLPPHKMRLKETGGKIQVFDPIRDKLVALTPEEYVRQQFVAWLISDLGYPAGLISNEIGLTLNETRRRCDTVVFGSDGSPRMIIEYKAPDVAVTQEVFDQIVRYNMVLTADYLIVSNGINHFCCSLDYVGNTYHFIPRIPSYKGSILPPTDN